MITAFLNLALFSSVLRSLQVVIQAPKMIRANAKKPTNLSLVLGQSPKANTPHKEVPNN